MISIVNNGIISVSSPFRITHFFNIKRPCPLITGVLLLHENKIHCVLIYLIFIMFQAVQAARFITSLSPPFSSALPVEPEPSHPPSFSYPRAAP